MTYPGCRTLLKSSKTCSAVLRPSAMWLLPCPAPPTKLHNTGRVSIDEWSRRQVLLYTLVSGCYGRCLLHVPCEPHLTLSLPSGHCVSSLAEMFWLAYMPSLAEMFQLTHHIPSLAQLFPLMTYLHSSTRHNWQSFSCLLINVMLYVVTGKVLPLYSCDIVWHHRHIFSHLLMCHYVTSSMELTHLAQRDTAWRLRQSFSHHVWHMWPVLTKWVFCAQIGLLFITFVCSLYSPWATIRLLHHFGFVCVLILGYPVRIFHATDTKYIMFYVGWRKSLKGIVTPAYNLAIWDIYISACLKSASCVCYFDT